MITDKDATGEDASRPEDSPTEDLSEGTVELRLPPRAEFLPVLRATVGMVAGQMSFDYDEVIQLRVAASEAFKMALGRLRLADPSSRSESVAVHLEVAPEELRVLVADPAAESGPLSADEAESRAVLESLVDRAEFGCEAAGARVIKLVKRR